VATSIAPNEPEAIPSPQGYGGPADAWSLSRECARYALDAPSLAPRSDAELNVLEIEEISLIKRLAIEQCAANKHAGSVEPRGLDRPRSDEIGHRLVDAPMLLARAIVQNASRRKDHLGMSGVREQGRSYPETRAFHEPAL
jgi:hypothetical protein